MITTKIFKSSIASVGVRQLCSHIYQLVVIFGMQVPEEVPAGHLHHRHWEVLRGNVHQPLQQTPCFSAKDMLRNGQRYNMFTA